MTVSFAGRLRIPGRRQAETAVVPPQEAQGRQSASGGGRVIGVLGAKGGSGSSTLALNLAVALARQGAPAALVDANLQQPQIAGMLQRRPQFGLLDVISRRPNIDLHLLEACAERIGPHCLLLTPPGDLETCLGSNLGELAEALESMRSLVPTWVLDLPRHLDKHLLRLIDRCESIVLVFEPTLGGVEAARRQVDLLRALEYDEGRVILAANRCCRKTRAVEKELPRCFAGSKIVALANDFDLLQSCLLSGEPATIVKPGAAYCKAVSALANIMVASGR